MPARIIEFEGLDCSFKETNSIALKKALEERGYDVHLFSFPNYGNESCTLVEKFLKDEFTFDTKKCTPYAISTFYSMDRYFTYMKDIKSIYENGDENTIIIFDRWVNSNFYQIARLKAINLDRLRQYNAIDEVPKLYKNAIASYRDWLYKFEFGALKLPRADHIIFMRTPYEISKKIIARKRNKDKNERDEEFTEKVYIINDIVFKTMRDVMIVNTCKSDGEFRSRKDIASEVLAKVLSVLE